MNERYDSLENFVKQIQGLKATKFGIGQIQKIYSSPHYIFMTLRSIGATNCIVIGRGQKFSGIHLVDRPIGPSFRIRDNFLEFFRKVFKSKTINKFNFNDKVLSFIFSEDSSAHLTFNSGDPCLIHRFKEKGAKKLINSTNMKKVKDVYEANDEVVNILIKLTKNVERLNSFDIDDYEKYLNSQLNNSKILKRKKKFNQRKKQKILDDYERLSLLLSKKKELIENRDAVEDIIIACRLEKKLRNINKTEHRVDKVFDLMKRYKKGLEIVEKRYDSIANLVKNPELVNIEISTMKRIYPRALTESEGSTKSTNVKKYKYKNSQIFLGKDTRGNDFIRNKIAKKEDYWFHLEGEKGSHAVIGGLNQLDLQDEIVSIVASILVDSSGLTFQEIPLVYAQVKDLRGVSGVAGKVTIKRPRYFRAQYIKNWKEIITELE